MERQPVFQVRATDIVRATTATGTTCDDDDNDAGATNGTIGAGGDVVDISTVDRNPLGL